MVGLGEARPTSLAYLSVTVLAVIVGRMVADGIPVLTVTVAGARLHTASILANIPWLGQQVTL